MRIKILERLRRAADPQSKTVANDLSRLDEARRGLGDEATDYVLTGRDEMVLSSIGTLCSGNPLEVAAPYLANNSASLPRRRLLARHHPFDVELAARYARVLAASCATLPDTAVGSKKTPQLVRVFFSEAFFGIRKRHNVYPAKPVSLDGKGLTLANARGMTAALEGAPVDLADVLYHEGPRYSSLGGELYRRAVSVRPFAESDAEAFIAASKRINAAARATLIQDLGEFGLAAQPDYLELVLRRAGDSSKTVREMAASVLSGLPAEQLEDRAAALLASGNVTMRTGMVNLMAALGSDSAIETLRAHRETEKTARVVSLIDTKLVAGARLDSGDADEDDATGYRAIDGSRVEIPPLRPLQGGGAPPLGAAEQRELARFLDEENARLGRQNEERATKGFVYKVPLFKKSVAAEAVALFNRDGSQAKEIDHRLKQFLSFGAGAKWSRKAIEGLPQAQALAVSYRVLGSIYWALSPYGQGPFIDQIRQWVDGPDGDLRHLEAFDIAMGTKAHFGWGDSRRERKLRKGDFLRFAIEDGYGRLEAQLGSLSADAIWPYLAEDLDVFDEAFGLRPVSDVKLSRIAAVCLLSRLPKAPNRYFAQLLEVATGETKGGRAEARAMLAQAPEVEKHIIGLLNDSRQAVRAGAAEWIAERHDEAAVPALRARLKKEKSELARAAILTTLDSLGEDLSGYLGPEALLAEAEKGLEKANFKKLDWMALDHLPRVHYRSGDAVPSEVLRWWLFLAVKLKQPGGNALFDIYLEQLVPGDAESLSTWVLDSWLNYDTARPAEEEANAHAQQYAQQRYKAWRRYSKDYTEEQAFADLKREFMSEYLNSGAATKGVLALAKRAPAVLAAERVRAYLKSHGSRTSQSSSLLELLAASGDPVALQVLISAATRLKQKGVQKFAGQLVQKVAEARSWSMDELADRTIPAAGLDDDGVLRLECGEDKVYEARLDDKLALALRNPAGKVVKSLPSGTDDAVKAAKKQLSASKRELKQIVPMQKARLYEALCAERVWSLEDWRRDFSGHPVMRKLIERVVWLGLDADGNIQGAFRPTAEGDLTDAHDDPVDIDAFAGVRLAYGSVMNAEEAGAWERHLADYEVTPLFTQVGRTLLRIDEGAAAETSIEDRKGWVTDSFTIRGAASKLGYERGEAMDAGYFNEYTKGFQSAGIMAVIEFSGNCLPEENVPAALISLSFEKCGTGRRMGHTVKLGDVPPVLLSECWNDYRAMATKAAFDEGWEKRMPWM